MYLSHYNIDLSKLSRDYTINPLIKGKSSRYGSINGEIPPYDDIFYLYITINLNLNDLADFFCRKRDTARLWVKHHNIVKSAELIRLAMKKTSLLKYNNPTYNNTDKSLSTKLEKYGKKGNGDGNKKLWQSISQDEKDLIVKKRKETCLLRYGFDNYMKNPYCLEVFLSNIRWRMTKPEMHIEKFFINNNIEYIYQYIIRENSLVKSYDFYLPKFNMLIEYDGDFWHRLEHQKENDLLKNTLAFKNGYRLTRIIGKENLDFFWEIQYNTFLNDK